MKNGILGAIADDFTGATDLAVAFRRAGLETLLYFGVPHTTTALPPHDAIVIALKSRTIAPEDAISQSTEALRWLQVQNADQFYFKYCSTFDSTPRGNIGPVLDALADALGSTIVMTTPSSPEHLRTMYQGQLFVGSLLLSESHMNAHPLTPMTDSFIPRVLARQTPHRVASLGRSQICEGVERVRAVIGSAHSDGTRYLMADAIDAADLLTVARSIVDAPLSAGAAGLGGAIAEARVAEHGLSGGRTNVGNLATDPVGTVSTAVLSGSCSARTLEQLAAYRESAQPSYRLDVLAEQSPEALAEGALAWFEGLPTHQIPVIYSSLAPEELSLVQNALGVEHSAHILESALAIIAVGLRDRGVRRIVAAGGETSGAIVSALEVEGGLIGNEAGRGVPWIYTGDAPPLALLLKSGNFGDRNFLVAATQSSQQIEREVTA